MDFLKENCSGTEMQVLMEDKVLSRACLGSLEVIGEVSSYISEDFKTAHPEVPWMQMSGMRNRPFRYFGVDWEIVHGILKIEIRLLRSTILRLLSELIDAPV